MKPHRDPQSKKEDRQIKKDQQAKVNGKAINASPAIRKLKRRHAILVLATTDFVTLFFFGLLYLIFLIS